LTTIALIAGHPEEERDDRAEERADDPQHLPQDQLQARRHQPGTDSMNLTVLGRKLFGHIFILKFRKKF
jgi:hypothetical protein